MTDTRDNGLIMPIIKVQIPEFISSHTMMEIKKEPKWRKPEDILQYLEENDSPIKTRASLLNYERRGLLTAMRVSAKKIYYDLNEVETLFKKIQK